jgi:hypothetical protein
MDDYILYVEEVKMRKVFVPIVLVLALVLMATPAAYALSPHDSGYKHGISDAKKAIEGRNDWYILQPGKGWTDHTGEFIQGYVEGFNSTKGIPKDWKAGYDYATKEWSLYAPGTPGDLASGNSTTGHPFACPLSKPYWRSNFCIGYDAALAYQNSDQ